MKYTSKMLAMLCVSLLVAATAQAAIVNVDIQATGGTTYVGLAAAPDAAGNTTWNAMEGDSMSNLTASDGSSTTIGVTLSNHTERFNQTYSGNNALTRDAVDVENTGVGNFGINGLSANTSYDIYLYTMCLNGGANNWGDTDYTIGSTTEMAISTGAPTATDGTGWTEGNQYVKITAVSDASGNITGTYKRHSNRYGLLTGMQIVPEPATMSLLGIGGLLALVRRRRK